jgi:hypothetical protein
MMATRVDPPQMAEMTEQEDTGEEVTSRCPDAPKKAPKVSNLEKISKNLGPDFAFAAVVANDQGQTAALAQFSEGKMSYAEMRMLCG